MTSVTLLAEEAPPSEHVEFFDEVVLGDMKNLENCTSEWVLQLKAGEACSPLLLATVQGIVHSRDGKGYTSILLYVHTTSCRREERRLFKRDAPAGGKVSVWITSCKSRRKRYYIDGLNDS